MTAEYEDLEHAVDIAQGDVIEWTGDAVNRPWKRFGVVITGDCDLHRNKTSGLITYLPAFTIEDYVWHVLRPLEFEKELNLRLIKLASRIDGWNKINGTPSALSVDVVLRWLRRCDREQLLDEMNCRDKGSRNTLAAVIDPAYGLLQLLDCEEPDLALLRKAYAPASDKGGSASEAMIKAVQKRLGSLPEDVFHLSVQPFDEEDGLFVMLRHVRQCMTSDIAKTPDELRFGSATGRRIARVKPTFRYALTQKFGRVFTDIGLPDDHEERRKTAAERFFYTRLEA